MRPPTAFRLLSVATILGLVHVSEPLDASAQGHPRVHLTFIAETTADSAAAEEYRQIWLRNEQRVVATLERISGRRFVTPAYADTAIAVRVLEAPANSGYRETPMRMRSSYPAATKLATLVHELGHRMQEGVARPGEEEHDVLFLWLYEVWVALEGKAWADQQVAFERGRSQRYVDAWDKALMLTPAQRAERWKALLAERQD